MTTHVWGNVFPRYSIDFDGFEKFVCNQIWNAQGNQICSVVLHMDAICMILVD